MSGPVRAAAGSSATSVPREELGALPAEADPDLSVEYTCEVLRTTKGMLKGCWAEFQPAAFYRRLPGEEPLTVLRHICIVALDIARYAEREGEVVDAEELGEGSYSRVFGSGALAAKMVSDRERPWVHKAAVEHAIMADRMGLGPGFYGHGTLRQTKGGSYQATVLLIERLDPLGDVWSAQDTLTLLDSVQHLAVAGLHNDLKLPNVMRRSGQPVLIDFDLFSPWAAKVAVTSSCLEHDFRALLEPLGEEVAARFREYYDLFAFTLTLEDGELYRGVLARLVELWTVLEEPALKPLLATADPDKLKEVPLEVLVRIPLDGVTVNLLDLRGNLYVHLDGDAVGRDARLQACGHLPQLVWSNGVYWP